MPELSLRGDDHSNMMMKTLEGLLESNVLVDCTLAAEGRFLKAHRVILSSCSPYFQLLFSQDTNQHPIIVFKDIEYKHLKMVLDYVYRGRVQVSQAQLNTFLEVANSLQIVGLDTDNKELISEESSSQIPDCNVKGSINQITQQCSEDGFDSKSMNTINSGYSTNLGPTPAPGQMDVLDSTSTIHIQSVYSLTSESTPEQHNLVTEDSIKFNSEVSDSKCNIKVEPVSVNKSHNGCAIDLTEQTVVCDGSILRSRNKHSHPDSLAHAVQINSEESRAIEPMIGHGVRVKRVKINPFSSGSETQATNGKNKLLIGNASSTTEHVNSTQTQHLSESISLLIKSSANEISERNMTDAPELAGSSINRLKSSKRKNVLPECVVQAERIVIDKHFEGNSSTSAQRRRASKFRVIPPREDSVKIHTIKQEKSARLPVREDNSGDGQEKGAKYASVHGLPPSTKVTIIPAGSGSQKLESNQKKKSCKDDKSTVLSQAFNQLSNSSEKTWPCNICDKQLGDKNALIDHMQLHKGEKPYSHQNPLVCHERTHSGEKPYKCNKCDRSFFEEITLTRHMLTHSGKRPFKCKFCNKSFIQHSNLVSHLQTHTKEKPFICNVCEQRFALKENLVSHIRIHTGEKPYECSICKKTFTEESALNHHLQTHSEQQPPL